MRILAFWQGAEPEAKLLLLLRIPQRSQSGKRPFAARVLFFNGLLRGILIDGGKALAN